MKSAIVTVWKMFPLMSAPVTPSHRDRVVELEDGQWLALRSMNVEGNAYALTSLSEAIHRTH